MNNAPIFIVDSDADDVELFEQSWKELKFPNTLHFFKYAEEVIVQLEKNEEVPFLIICEFNLPRMSGLELKKYLKDHAETNYKSLPFVFVSGTISQAQIEQAYDEGTNGVFRKPTSFEKWKMLLFEIAEYWRDSIVPIN